MSGLAWGSRRARRLLLATVAASGMGFLDGSVVGVALPAIGRDLDAGIAGLQWVLNGYMLTLAALILIGGSLGDHLGRRRVFLVGTVWFALASMLCAFAPDIGTLIAARLLQGVGAALLTPGSLALLEAEFDEADRSRAIGAWSGLTGAFNAVGPFLGGWLVDAGSWRYIFLINAPLALLVVIVTLRHVGESRTDARAGLRDLDWRAALATVIALGGITEALTAAGGAGIASVEVLLPAAIGALAALLFARSLRRSPRPLIPAALLGSRRFIAANLATVGIYAALGISFFLLVVQLQQVLGYSALAAGAATLPITLSMLALSARSGQLAQRIGPRLQMGCGPLLMASGLLLLRRAVAGADYVLDIFPGLLVVGLGLAATVAPLTATALGAAGPDNAGIASGVNNAVSRAAQLAAVAAIPPLVGIGGRTWLDAARFSAGFEAAMLIAAGLCAAAGISAWLLLRSAPLTDSSSGARGAGDYLCGLDSTPLRRGPRDCPPRAPDGR